MSDSKVRLCEERRSEAMQGNVSIEKMHNGEMLPTYQQGVSKTIDLNGYGQLMKLLKGDKSGTSCLNNKHSGYDLP